MKQNKYIFFFFFFCSKNKVISGLQSQRLKVEYRYLGRKARSTFRYGEAAMEGLLQRVIYSPETTEQEKKSENATVQFNKIITFIVYQEKRSLNEVLTHPSIRVQLKNYR